MRQLGDCRKDREERERERERERKRERERERERENVQKVRRADRKYPWEKVTE